MKRRNFLKTLLAAPAIPLVGKAVAEAEPVPEPVVKVVAKAEPVVEDGVADEDDNWINWSCIDKSKVPCPCGKDNCHHTFDSEFIRRLQLS